MASRGAVAPADASSSVGAQTQLAIAREPHVTSPSAESSTLAK
jgi:hypothetical protein